MIDIWDKISVDEETNSAGESSEKIEESYGELNPMDMYGSLTGETVSNKKEREPWYKSVPKDVLKGFLEGSVRVGRMMGPLATYQGEEPFSQERFSEQLDEVLPSDSNVIGKGARRTLNIAAPALANPLAAPAIAAAQSLGGGILGQAIEEGGGGEILQTAGEVLPFLFGGGTPGGKIQEKGTKISKALSKAKFLPKKIREIMGKRAADQEEINQLIRFAEAQGMTAAEIAPLVNGQTKKDLLSKFATKRGATQSRLSNTKKAISEVADRFKTGKYADIPLESSKARLMVKKLQDILYDMPAKSRNVIMEDFQQLANSPKDTKSIVKFFRDINAQYGQNKAHLGRLKKPLQEALSSINPDLGKDFKLTNKLFERYYDIANKLKPSIAHDILGATTIPRISIGLATGNYPLIYEAVGEQVARKFASEMLTNPKFMDISKKLVNALNKGQFAIADRIKDEYIRSVKDEYPDIAAELGKETFREFIKED